jgi:hypothetical protein
VIAVLSGNELSITPPLVIIWARAAECTRELFTTASKRDFMQDETPQSMFKNIFE